MAPPPPRHAPTTLKQAKKAYQKTGAGPRLSEAEVARLQRLQEREEKHERMRERERKRLLNRKKRDEKIAKEKELRKKMGLPEPGAPYIGPSQARISQFVKGGKTVRFEGAAEQKEEEGEDEEMPLSGLDEEVLACLASPVSEKSKTPRKPLERLDGNRALSQGTKRMSSNPNVAEAADDDWASIFVSNTQIQRELSTDDDDNDDGVQEDAPQSTQKRASALSHPPAANEADETANLLAMINTQDLEDAEEFDQSVLSASTQYPEFTEEELCELEMPERPASASTQYPDFTEEEFRVLGMSELSSSTRPRHGEAQRATTPDPMAAGKSTRDGSHADPARTSFDIDDFELSTQDLQELGA
ncbi:MAG: hypothetical protein FRX48_01026 [Lasallia pustulata]|uniref:Uncharacterized protein n=1 Tax=Lasallia pustulata TaxID=136370 RepID=A0A5M8Q271_9LECA|nr:MAG: hypothetical protein FRX48_01026 [Lasallia pustulata]